jgi:hypothetical protein
MRGDEDMLYDLIAYVTVAMVAWTQADKAPVDEARLRSIATDIVTVVEGPDEEPVWKDDERRVKTALLMANIARYEGSGYQEYVDELRCNDPEWRKMPEGQRAMRRWGDCDHGLAYSMWQVHVSYEGIVLTHDGSEYVHAGAYPLGDPHWQQAIKRRDMADRKTAVHVALHMARKSIRAGAGLCQYTGELGPCPKGDERLKPALAWYKAHPFEVVASEP